MLTCLRIRIPFFSLLFLLLTVAIPHAQTAGTRGVVSDQSGTPVRGATVRLLDQGGERGRAETDENGAFVVAVECVACTVEVSKAGFETAATRPGAARATNITLLVASVREDLVVTATGREVPISQVGASVTVLDRVQIEQRHALSTIDLLRTVPGVVAARTGGVGGLTSTWVRGGESTYNKVLLDGMPLNEPGGYFNFGSFSPENIERIEVLRGAHSALFGSDAMASVIQMFTARPETGRPQANLTIDGGTYDTFHLAAGVGGRSGAVEYSMFGSRLQTDNREPNNQDHATTFSGMLVGRLSSGSTARVLGRGEFGKTGVPGPSLGRPDMDAFFKHDDGSLLGGWNQPLGSRAVMQASYSVSVTHQRSTNLIADPPYLPRLGNRVATSQSSDFPYDSGTNLQRHHIDYRADSSISANQTLTAAFAYDGERGVLTDYQSTSEPHRPSRNNTGVTVQYEGTAGAVSLVGGVRFEHNGSFGSHAAPRAAVSWLVREGNEDAGATRLRGSAGLGIKEPTFLQSYSPSPFFRGNPDLEPEESRSFDIGLEQRLAHDRLGVELTYFANHFDNLISLGPSDPSTFESQYANIGETRASGWELTGDSVVPGGLRLRGTYTFLDAKVLKSSNAFSAVFAAGRQLYRRPRHSGSVDLSYTRDRVGVTVGGLFVGERVDTISSFPAIESNDGHATWNASGDVKLARRTSAFIAFENLADRDYMEPLGYRALGRTVRLGVRTRF